MDRQKQFLENVSGKLVLGYGYDERYAKILEQYGAAGWIQIWTSGEDVIHEDTVSPVWGTPDMDSSLFQLKMPVVAISGPTGEYLIQKLENARKNGQILYADLDSRRYGSTQRAASHSRYSRQKKRILSCFPAIMIPGTEVLLTTVLPMHWLWNLPNISKIGRNSLPIL